MRRLLSIVLIGSCISVSTIWSTGFAESINDDSDLSYKIWENEKLYPSLTHYLENFETIERTSVSPEDSSDLLIKTVDSAIDSQDLKDDGFNEQKISLNLREAMQIAVSSNRDVQLALLDPALAQTDLDISKTVYDPTLFSDNNYYDTDRPIRTLLDTGSDGTGLDGKDRLLENGWLSHSGVRQPLPTGGQAILAYEADHLESNSDLTIPNPQYTSRLRLELRQSLLKELGDKTNKSDIELARLSREQAEGEYETSLSDIMKGAGALLLEI